MSEWEKIFEAWKRGPKKRYLLLKKGIPKRISCWRRKKKFFMKEVSEKKYSKHKKWVSRKGTFRLKGVPKSTSCRRKNFSLNKKLFSTKDVFQKNVYISKFLVTNNKTIKTRRFTIKSSRWNTLDENEKKLLGDFYWNKKSGITSYSF